MAAVGGLPGGSINPRGQGADGIRPPASEGRQVSGHGQQPGRDIAHGSLVDGLVTGRGGDLYQVRIGAHTLNARSTVPLFVGQRFRAVWDSSSSPPILRLEQQDTAVLSSFTGRDRDVAAALLRRGMPLDEVTVLELRRQWIKSGGEAVKLSALSELLARDIPFTGQNVSILVWYMGLGREDAARIWKKIRERLKNMKHLPRKELLEALRGDSDEEVRTFVKAHALAGRPARDGIDPAVLTLRPWWPVGDSSGQVMVRVAFSFKRQEDRGVWRSSFVFDGSFLGPVEGSVISNGRAMSVSFRLESEAGAEAVRNAEPQLRRELEEIPLALQYVGVVTGSRNEPQIERRYSLDMEI